MVYRCHTTTAATLLLTMSEIINFQKEYFQEGDETKLRPDDSERYC